MKFSLLVFLFLLPFAGLFAQKAGNDTSRLLPEVKVTGQQIDLLSCGLQIIEIDSVLLRDALHRDLDGLLEKASPVFIKNYGPGGIATVSFRGLSAAHSHIYWNGIPLSSPNLGMQDLSLIPGGIFDRVYVQTGGSSAILGNGSIAGGIHLDNEINFIPGSRREIAFSAGTAHRANASVNFTQSGKKAFYKFFSGWKRNKNDFTYTGLHGKKRQRKNAGEEAFSVFNEFAYRLSGSSRIRLGLWWEKARVEIPASLTAKESDAFSKTVFLRNYIQYLLQHKKWYLTFTTAFLPEHYYYEDPDTIAGPAIKSRMKSNSWHNAAEGKYAVSRNTSFIVNVNYRREEAVSNNYQRKITRHTGRISTGITNSLFSNKLQSNIMLSKLFVKGSSPLLFSGNLSVALSPSLKIKGHISRNYRLPGFNDLYWVPLGNPDLRPEYSNNREAGIEYQPAPGDRSGIQISFWYYRYHLKDRILWRPENGTWRPVNLDTVLSRGIETYIDIHCKTNTIKHKLILQFTYNQSTAQNNKRMMYTPAFTFNSTYIAGYKNFIITVHQAMVSSYYTNMDNSAKMPGYAVTDISLFSRFEISKKEIHAGIAIDNLFDKEYQIIRYYPLPGRSVRLTFALRF